MSTKSNVAHEELLKNTNFNRAEFEVLLQNFKALGPIDNAGVEKVDRQHFRDLLSEKFGITESLLMDRVFRVFDADADNHISFEEYIKGMSIFLKGKLDERMKFCFKIYDLNGDRYISKEEMFQMLQHCLVKGADEDEDGVKDLVDLILKKLDEDRDGRVNETDYATAVNKDSLLLEAFGQCLPNPRDINEYLQISRSADSDDDRQSAHLTSHGHKRGGMVGSGAVERRSAKASAISNKHAGAGLAK